ncbi:hypothetical protein OCU04_004092 [Sclerotinia nivalis]|uniref:SWIM-type domain-containing protein n=1 Tax=Sclerotinia nivalis TaxID=352851 RepID=A0A9X0AT91_9HELO|nr:hypothetical protein OCU04_004092 [Sclerotinia nivalis]
MENQLNRAARKRRRTLYSNIVQNKQRSTGDFKAHHSSSSMAKTPIATSRGPMRSFLRKKQLQSPILQEISSASQTIENNILKGKALFAQNDEANNADPIIIDLISSINSETEEEPDELIPLPSTKIAPDYEDDVGSGEAHKHWSQCSSSLRFSIPRGSTSIEQLSTPIAEQRLRSFLEKPTARFQQLLRIVETQTMYCLYHNRVDEIGDRKEKYRVVGTTGNMYSVIIAKQPTCTCLDWRGNYICEHIVFIFVKVLKLSTPLRHQVAFLSTEVEQMLNVVIIDEYCDRKSIVKEPRCPICYKDLNADADADKDTLTWCKSSCGINYHQSCILRWAAVCWQDGRKVKCGYCNMPWVFTSKEVSEAIRNGGVSIDDNTNVGRILGMEQPELEDTEFWRPRQRFSIYERYRDERFHAIED